MSNNKQTCLYKLLDLDPTATTDQIKKAYRTKALLLHPDKRNQVSQVEKEKSTDLFLQIQNAYEILTDPQERSWYDRFAKLSHDSTTSTTSINSSNDLNCYFNSSSIKSTNEFYLIYNKVFDQIIQFEFARFDSYLFTTSEKEQLERLKVPFGNENSLSPIQIKQFYSVWSNFTSKAIFYSPNHTNRSNSMGGVNRRTKRIIQKEDEKYGERERKRFTETVRSLVSFVKKRDVRIIKMNSTSNTTEIKKEREEKRIYKQTEFDQDYENALKRIEDFDLNDQQQQNEEEEDNYCFACKISIPQEQDWLTHQSSENHKQNAIQLRRELEEEEEGMVVPQKEKEIDQKEINQKEKQKQIKPNQNKKDKEEEKQNKKQRKEQKRQEMQLTCSICSVKFESRNQLFNHLRNSKEHFNSFQFE